MDISIKNRIQKYLKSSSRTDEDAITDLFLNSANESELEQASKEQWDRTTSEPVDLQHVLHRIHFQINSSLAIQKPVSRLLHIYSRVAAILLIPVLLGSLFVIYDRGNPEVSRTEIISQKGSRVKFILPDGSTGYLNSGSTLSYAENFKTNRIITMDGEGYFDVTKDKEHPFVVQTKYADISVLGTKFDLCAYSTDDKVFTTLEEGSVVVTNNISHKDAVLKPGDQLQISTNNGEMKLSNVNTQLYTSWKDNMLRFDNSPFEEVVKKMERWYGIKIILDESLKNSESYTLTVKTESLREFLQLLSLTTPMSYKIEKDTLFIYSPMKK